MVVWETRGEGALVQVPHETLRFGLREEQRRNECDQAKAKGGVEALNIIVDNLSFGLIVHHD